MSRGNYPVAVRPSRLGALVAAGAMLVTLAQLESRAAITLGDPFAQTRVQGELLGNHSIGGDPPIFVQDTHEQYDVIQTLPPGSGSFMLPGIPPPGKTSIPGASAVTNANVNTTITLNTVADTLSVTSSGSVSAVLSGTFNSQRRDIAVANGSAAFNMSFRTDREYDYTITSSVSARAQEFGPFAGGCTLSQLSVWGSSTRIGYSTVKTAISRAAL